MPAIRGCQMFFAEWREDPRFIAIVKDLGLPNGYDPVTKTARWP